MEKLRSRKFWMAVVSAVLIVLNDGLGWNIPTETVMSFVAVVLGYLLGQSYVDGHHDHYKITEYEISDIEDF